MTECRLLSDRMPAVALARSDWSSEESRHLGQCRSCRDEWELVRAASRLGDGLIFVSDPSRIAGAALQRDRKEKGVIRPPAWRRGSARLAAAAAIAGAVWLGWPDAPQTAPRSVAPEIAAGRLDIPLVELDSLQPAELDSVLQTMDEATGALTVDASDLADLDTDELQQVLESWEG